MSRTSVLMLLGIVVILTPFSGLPSPFRSLLAVICGIGVIGIALALRAERARQKPPTE